MNLHKITLFVISGFSLFEVLSCKKTENKKNDTRFYLRPDSANITNSYANDTVRNQKSYRWSHGSHASHYSGVVTYEHNVDKYHFKRLNIGPKTYKKIHQILEHHFNQESNADSVSCSFICETSYVSRIDEHDIKSDCVRILIDVQRFDYESHVRTTYSYDYYISTKRNIAILYNNLINESSHSYSLSNENWLYNIMKILNE